MTPQHYPPTFLPRFSALNPPEKLDHIKERYSTTLDIEIEKKSKNVGNLRSIMDTHGIMELSSTSVQGWIRSQSQHPIL